MDSRVVDLPMTYDLTFDMLLSLKPLFFNSLKISHDSQTTLKHKTLESNKSVGKMRLEGQLALAGEHGWRWLRPLPTQVVGP